MGDIVSNFFFLVKGDIVSLVHRCGRLLYIKNKKDVVGLKRAYIRYKRFGYMHIYACSDPMNNYSASIPLLSDDHIY